MSESTGIRLTLQQEGPYAFRVSFEGTDLDAMLTDEPAPLGSGQGPSPVQLLLAAVANNAAAAMVWMVFFILTP